MKTVIKLDEKDIIKILAEKFGVDETKVDLITYKSWSGYGPTEEEILACKCEIEKD